VYKSLHENNSSFLWDKCPRIQMLSPTVNPFFSDLRRTVEIFFRVAVPFYIPASDVWVTYE